MKRNKGELSIWQTFILDMQRYVGDSHKPWSLRFLKSLIRAWYEHPGLMAVVVYRYGQWVEYRCRIPIVKQICNLHYYWCYNWVRHHLQIEVPRSTDIGAGFRIDHFGGIIINSRVRAGRNLTVTSGVIIGQSDTGIPCLKDNISIGVGAKVIGGTCVGNNALIGAMALVVTKDVPDNAVMGGVPAKVLRFRDSLPMLEGEYEENRGGDSPD